MELKLKYNLEDELILRNSLSFGFSSLEDMRKKFYAKFKEQEKARGYGLNTFLRPVSEDFEILENDEIALIGEEEEFNFEMFMEEVEKPKEVSRVYSNNPFLEALNGYSYCNQEEKKPVEQDSLRNWGINEDYHEVVHLLPKKPNKTNIKEVVSNVREQKRVDKIYTNLIDFIKDNPNCSVQEASKFFSNKEIQKQIKMGKVFLRRGRLSV